MAKIQWRKGHSVRVGDIMTKDVATCAPTDTLERAARLMWERDCGVVPVLQDGDVVGMITDRDCCMAAYTRGRRLDEIPIEETMSREIVSCGPDDGLDRVEARLRRNQIRRMPVLRGTELVGIVSLNDLALAAERGQEDPKDLAGTLAGISHHRPRPVAAE